MGSYLILEDDRFEWDDRKAALSLTKHRLSFEYAVTVFDDIAAIELPDQRRDYGEERIKLVGRAWDGGVLAVIFTERGERIRVISARLANRKERALYAQG
jgi:uncharacterized DUF497 family protein